MKFVRAATLNDESKKTAAVKPDVHIWTSTKMDWVDLTGEKARGVPIMEGPYRLHQVWRKEALERFTILKEEIGKGKKVEEQADRKMEQSKV